ncbi:protein CROWDED NUCLEI 1 isoform X2 [Phalaenopsis equestris]|uniref:protein CROWDED NUCLEI 1 isoform X2 n=1 Tax=Phalaenopsis equestris TaxID=78828 RepID=UPI0009E5F18F|nr:protein CROWDED NUCLEI 1 isoform X2 [Phalaenopsis equestris]
MFTPQSKGGWAGWSSSPLIGRRRENGSALQRTNSGSVGAVHGRGKGATASEATPPLPSSSLLSENIAEVMGGSDVSKDCKRFGELGPLDEGMLSREDKEELYDRVSALESERDECLYNMGLLLIEKKEWSSKIEELKQALIDSQEILKREQEARIFSISELEKREENLKKALGVEKQCVIDLEKTLHVMRAEIAETKFISDNRLADARAIEASLQEKKMEIEAKVRAADTKLAEANRKNSDSERKLENVAARESKIQRDLSSLYAEKKTLETDVSKQREHFREWEEDLQDKHIRLLNEQSLLNEREERANDLDIILKKKEAEIEDARKNADAARSILKSQEDGLKLRLRTLTVKEKDVEIKSSNLEKKEKDLMAIEEKLNLRENEEIQKLLDEHNATLDAKKREFELEMVKKRQSFDEEVKNHISLLDKEKRQVRCQEEQLIKREEALDNKTNKLKSKEEDLDTKSKALKKWEESLKMDEKKLQEERKRLIKDSNELEATRAKLHNEKLAIETEEQKVVVEKENLRLTREEREQHLKLQEELKLEKDEYRMMAESLENEKDVLRQEKEKFERDWEVLDDRRAAIEAEVKQLSAEREKFEKWQHTEEERLKKVDLQARTALQRELEDLRLKKEAFEKMMAHEREVAHAEVDREHADMTREFDLLKHELEMNMQRRHNDVEKELEEKENKFERWRQVELSRIKSLSESNDLKRKSLDMEQNQLQMEKAAFTDQRGKLEADRQEIQNDIDILLRLSKNLKDQREEFAKEKGMFLSVVEQCNTCHNCGVPIYNIDHLDLQPLKPKESCEEIILPSLADGFLEEHIKGRDAAVSPGVQAVESTNSGSQMTRWLQRCANLFKVSPKNVHAPSEGQVGTSFGEQLDSAALENSAYEPSPSANHSFEHQVHFDGGDGMNGQPGRLHRNGDEAESSFGVADSSKDIVRVKDNSNQKNVVVIDDENNDMQGSFIHAENDSQPEPSKQGQRRQPSRKAKANLIRRTRSVKAVVEDAKVILGESFELKIDEQQNDDGKIFQNIPDESQGASVQADQAETRTKRKRSSKELEKEGSEAHSESVSRGRHSKRRQTSSLLPAAADRRYNLRRSTVASTAAASQATSHQKEASNVRKLKTMPENIIREGGYGGERISGHDRQQSRPLENSAHLPPKSANSNVLKVNSKDTVQHEDQELYHDAAVLESTQFSAQTAEEGDEVDGASPPRDLENSSSDVESESDDMDKHNASIGKKLWNFLTT